MLVFYASSGPRDPRLLQVSGIMWMPWFREIFRENVRKRFVEPFFLCVTTHGMRITSTVVPMAITPWPLFDPSCFPRSRSLMENWDVMQRWETKCDGGATGKKSCSWFLSSEIGFVKNGVFACPEPSPMFSFRFREQRSKKNIDSNFERT